MSGRLTRVLFSADLTCADLQGIIRVSRAHGNEHRLDHDVAKLPHHCSYLSLAPDKDTSPVPEVRWLFEERGQEGEILVSSSNPIPQHGTNDPPHHKAAAFYRQVSDGLLGEFVVTMEHPKVSTPERLVIDISASGASRKKRIIVGSAAATRPARRAG